MLDLSTWARVQRLLVRSEVYVRPATDPLHPYSFPLELPREPPRDPPYRNNPNSDKEEPKR